MDLILPSFDDRFLQEFSVCAVFQADSDARFDGMGCETRVQCKYKAENGVAACLRVAIDTEDRKYGHVHCDIAREGIDDEYDSVQNRSIQEVSELLGRFNGQKAEIDLNGKYQFSLKDLPRRGMISALLGVETESCGARLRLHGATMSISGDLYTSLRWKFDPDEDTVCAVLLAETEANIESSYLSSLADILREGVDCFILENPRNPAEDAKYTRRIKGKMRHASED